MSGRAVVTLVVSLLGASCVFACPLCDSETGRRVRAGIFDADFGYHLLVTALPFPVLLGIVALLHLGRPRPKRSPSPPAAENDPWPTH